VVYPNGSGPVKDVLLTWNAEGCCSYAMDNDVDDVAFIRILIEKLTADYAVDEKRIYATGFSNGAMLSFRLGAALTEKLAAIAPVSGAMFESSEDPKGRLPVLIIHGTADTAVPFDGGYSQRRQIKRAQREPYKSVSYAATLWAKNNGCRAKPLERQAGRVIIDAYGGCVAGNDVEIYKIVDGAHAWPGGRRGRDEADAPSTDISATDIIWDFFKAHKRK
jgi:polyhydroxybutyrate depolymerase